MEAEICDLDELTGSALGDQPPILVFSSFPSSKSLFLSLSLVSFGCVSVTRLCFNCSKFRAALN